MARSILALTFFLHFSPTSLSAIAAEAPDKSASSHAYCIVGGGPAGLQLGHFLKHAGRDYVIFDRSQHAGSFFRKFPRHRRLISLNKRYVREGRSAEFAFRHDWNSLIDVRREAERTPPVTTRSEDLFPLADVLADYMADFAEEQHPFIRFGTSVRHISPEDSGGFAVTVEVDVNGKVKPGEIVHCNEVIVAGGFWKARSAKVVVDGSDFVDGYEDVPETGHSYAGKSVVILGLGNAAMETAQALMPFTSEVHVWARRRDLPQGGKGVRFAYETHYVGDIRAGRTTILDTYLLKSLDSFDFTSLDGGARVVVIPCLGKRRCVWKVFKDDCMDKHCEASHSTSGQNLKYKLPVLVMVKQGFLAKKVEKILKELVPVAWRSHWEVEPANLQEDEDEDQEITPAAKEATKQQRIDLGIDEDLFAGAYEELIVSSTLLRQFPAVMDALAPLRAEHSQGDTRHPKDHVIRCFGWYMDRDVFDTRMPLKTTHKGKYPALTSNFSADGVPGLYFAGTLTHGLDFRKSAGGFIHGFRYTARALFRALEEKNSGVAWPHTSVELKAGLGGLNKGGAKSPVNQVAEMMLRRINEASGPYQMFEFLGDMVVFEQKVADDSGNIQWTARFLEEVPLTHFHERYKDSPRMTWTFRYGEGFYGPQVLGEERVGSTSMYTAHKSKFLHPHIQFFEAGSTNATKAIWITEDIYTSWTGLQIYLPVVRFVSKVVARLTGNKQWANRASGMYSDEYVHDTLAQTGDPVESSGSANHGAEL